jgi:hypothetical protein
MSVLTCPNCKSVFTDPGGDTRRFACTFCGYVPLQRTPSPAPPINNEAVAGLMAGAAVGAVFGSWPGAVIGGLIGAFLASHKEKPEYQSK